MKLNRILAGLLAVTSMALVATTAQAQALTGTLKKIQDSGTITMGVRDSSVPFSYLDDKQQPVGYSVDLCYRIVDAVKTQLKMPNLKVVLQPVTSATRIPLMANGTIDLECGSTTNSIDRQKQVSFVSTTFVTASRLVAKKSSKVSSLNDLRGKSIVSTAGTTSLRLLNELNGERKLGMNILSAKDHAESFLMVKTGRAVAFAMDDILLYSLVASDQAPGDYMITNDALSVEPYGIMVRKDDPAFKRLADTAIANVFKSGEINRIYAKWFTSPIPPKGINLNVPMSDVLKRVIGKPTDSGDPAVYM